MLREQILTTWTNLKEKMINNQLSEKDKDIRGALNDLPLLCTINDLKDYPQQCQEYSAKANRFNPSNELLFDYWRSTCRLLETILAMAKKLNWVTDLISQGKVNTITIDKKKDTKRSGDSTIEEVD